MGRQTTNRRCNVDDRNCIDHNILTKWGWDNFVDILQIAYFSAWHQSSFDNGALQPFQTIIIWNSVQSAHFVCQLNKLGPIVNSLFCYFVVRLQIIIPLSAFAKLTPKLRKHQLPLIEWKITFSSMWLGGNFPWWNLLNLVVNKKRYAFYIIPHWNGTGAWKPSSWRANDISILLSIMPRDDVTMKTSSNGNIFPVNSPLYGEFTG